MSLSYFPQLATGALTQFPIEKSTSYRTIVNQMEDGSRVVLADPNAGTMRWNLSYVGLSDAESDAIAEFFLAMEGRLGSFTFFDPVANLIGWSDTFDASAWQRNALLSLQTGTADPLGTQRAATLSNSSSAGLAFGQTLPMPGQVTCCWSFYARSNSSESVTLIRSSGGATAVSVAAVGPAWQHCVLSSVLGGGSDTSTFQLTLAGGESLDVFGLQVDAQPAPSQYTPTTLAGGIYPATRFDSDELAITATGPNQNSCVLNFVTYTNG